jgi:hypothetical protein
MAEVGVPVLARKLHILKAKRVLTSTLGKSVFTFMTSIILYAIYSEQHKRFPTFTLWPLFIFILPSLLKILFFLHNSSFIDRFVLPITLDARTVFACSNTWDVGSDLTPDMDVCVFISFVLSCV